jgi:hypothetical protein
MVDISESLEVFGGYFGPSLFLKVVAIFKNLQDVVIFVLIFCNSKVLKLISKLFGKTKKKRLR